MSTPSRAVRSYTCYQRRAAWRFTPPGFAAATRPRAGGGLLVGVGVLEMTGAWASVIIWFKVHWFANYTAPL
jgi:hypothetical protein